MRVARPCGAGRRASEGLGGMEFEQDRERSPEEIAREERIKRLILAAVSRCSACRRSYTLTDFAVLGHHEHLWMVTVICADCHHQGFVTAVIQGRPSPGTKAVPTPLLELSPAERARFASATPVVTDDLLDLHLFLDEFDGDFAGLFGVGEDN